MLSRLLLALSALASFFLTALCLDIRGTILFNEFSPDAKALGTAKVILDHGVHYGKVMKDGKFAIPNVPIGTYILSVLSHDVVFDQLRVDVQENITVSRPYIAGTPLDPPSTVQLTHPLVLVPKQRHNYFVPKESFNLLQMLSNPMMMLMVGGGALVLGMPYIMKNMDPEALEEFKQQQAKIADIQGAMASGDLKAGVSALMNAGGDAPQTDRKPGPQTPRNKPGKKRQ